MAEKALLEGGLSVKVMPVPSSVREGCGFCLRLIPEELERAAIFLSEHGITLTEVYLPAGEPASYKKTPIEDLPNGKKHDERR